LCTRHPIYLILHQLLPSSPASTLSLTHTHTFFFFSSPSSPPFDAHSLTSSLHRQVVGRCRPSLPPLVGKPRAGAAPPLLSTLSPTHDACGRWRSFHGELECDDIPRPCSLPTSTRQSLSTWTGLVPSLRRGAFLDSQVPPRFLHRAEEA
jgi:hypothetical protein